MAKRKRNRTNGAVELLNIETDRVDGVDEPATGRKFLLVKSEDINEIRDGAEDIIDGVHELLDSIADEGSAVSKSVVDKLNELAELTSYKKRFKPGKPKDEEEEEMAGKKKKAQKAEAAEGGDDDPDVIPGSDKLDSIAAAINALGKDVRKMNRRLQKVEGSFDELEDIARVQLGEEPEPVSKQADGDGAGAPQQKKLGEGLFEGFIRQGAGLAKV